MASRRSPPTATSPACPAPSGATSSCGSSLPCSPSAWASLPACQTLRGYGSAALGAARPRPLLVSHFASPLHPPPRRSGYPRLPRLHAGQLDLWHTHHLPRGAAIARSAPGRGAGPGAQCRGVFSSLRAPFPFVPITSSIPNTIATPDCARPRFAAASWAWALSWLAPAPVRFQPSWRASSARTGRPWPRPRSFSPLASSASFFLTWRPRQARTTFR